MLKFLACACKKRTWQGSRDDREPPKWSGTEVKFSISQQKSVTRYNFSSEYTMMKTSDVQYNLMSIQISPQQQPCTKRDGLTGVHSHVQREYGHSGNDTPPGCGSDTCTSGRGEDVPRDSGSSWNGGLGCRFLERVWLWWVIVPITDGVRHVGKALRNGEESNCEGCESDWFSMIPYAVSTT